MSALKKASLIKLHQLAERAEERAVLRAEYSASEKVWRRVMRQWALRWRAEMRQFGNSEMSHLCLSCAIGWRNLSLRRQQLAEAA